MELEIKEEWTREINVISVLHVFVIRGKDVVLGRLVEQHS